MRQTWQNCFALLAAMAMAGTAQAQSDWNQPSAIGSYQSILARAGYGNQAGRSTSPTIPAVQASTMMQGSGSKATVPPTPSMQGSASKIDGGMMHEHTTLGSSSAWGAPITSGTVESAPTMAPTSGAVCSSCVDGASVPSGAIHDGAIYDGAVSSSLGQHIYNSEPCCSGVYESYAEPVIAATPQKSANHTASIFGLFFQRDYEDNRLLGTDAGGGSLFTNDADENNFDGYGLSLARRNANGRGFELVYWALNPGAVSAGISGAPVNTSIRGLDRLTHTPSGRNVFDIYTGNLSQSVVRNTNINNVEFNLLRNGGQFSLRGNRRGFYELLFGFRWFDFDEQLQYLAETDTGAFPTTPANFAYTLNAENTLLGFQLGARNELCLSNRLRLYSGVKGGLYNNFIRSHQSIVGSDDIAASINTGPSAGRAFDFSDTKNDVAFLGELDLGVLVNLTSRSRIRFGYRAIGVAGVALAADQIPNDFADINELQNAQSNGSLLLNGGYYGLEFCF